MIIKRTNDYNIFSDKELEKIAKVVSSNDNIKLFDIVNAEDEALLIKKQLKIEGYGCKIEQVGDKWRVYAVIPEKIKLESAIKSGAFKKLAWGRYSFQKQSAMNDYDFDDGSIWRVITDKDGQEYLIIEIDDEDGEIIREKLANCENQLVNDNNIKRTMSILYNNNYNTEFLDDLLRSDIKNNVYAFLNNKLSEKIDHLIVDNHFINSPNYNKEIKEIVKTSLNDNLESESQLEALICDYSNRFIFKTGTVPKLFN